MKVAIIIGHNNIKKGAYSNFLKKNEFDYYCDVINYFKNIKDVDIYYRKESGSYIEEMKKIVHSINLNKYDFAIELHFNSANSDKIHGAEVLAHAKSIKGNKLGNIFLEKLCEKYNSKNRGIVKIKDEFQRGGYGICKTKCPYVLVEPFFGSNEESNKFLDKEKFATFLIEFIKGVELC